MCKFVIAHDVGTSSVKTALINNRGEVMAHATSAYGFNHPKPGWVEQDPADYWKGSVQNTREIIRKSKVELQKITGIVFSTQAMGIIPVDHENKLLNHNITWVDGRAEDQARWLMNLLGGRRIFVKLFGVEITGKDVRYDHQIFLEHGKPMIFGKDRDKGLMMRCDKMVVVTIGENGVTEEDLIVHNARDADDTNHYRLVRMSLPDFPVAMGVIRAVDSTVYESELFDQVQHAKKTSKIRNMDDLLNSGNVFESKG